MRRRCRQDVGPAVLILRCGAVAAAAAGPCFYKRPELRRALLRLRGRDTAQRQQANEMCRSLPHSRLCPRLAPHSLSEKKRAQHVAHQPTKNSAASSSIGVLPHLAVSATLAPLPDCRAGAAATLHAAATRHSAIATNGTLLLRKPGITSCSFSISAPQRGAPIVQYVHQ